MRLNALRRELQWIGLVVLALITGCAAHPAAMQVTLDAETTASALPTVVPVEITEPAVTADPTSQGPFSVVVWWPEPLAPLDNETAAETLSEQLSAFQRNTGNTQVEFRLKKVEDVGGIMSTLRTASAVAPGALPDLTLLRRDDLLMAVQAGLAQPLSQRLSPAILEELPTSVLALGRVDEQLYGLPYTIEIQHVAYTDGTTPASPATFSHLLDSQTPFVFAAGRTSSVSDVFLLQYLAANGTWSGNGPVKIDEAALQSTLTFYQQAVAAGIISPDVLEYTNPSDYQTLLNSADSGEVVVTSSQYLKLTSDGSKLSVSQIPTASGKPVTMLDGWMWVMTTSDADRQTRALRFLNWMLDADRQRQYTQIVHMLPSQRTALRQMPDTTYIDFVNTLLANATLPLAQSESGAAARAMQNALASVLSGQHTADDATREVMLGLSS
jgi:ABC-type glycerol-3-phosphate transport system substrate-binding protein